jgi:hypothetical protein
MGSKVTAASKNIFAAYYDGGAQRSLPTCKGAMIFSQIQRKRKHTAWHKRKWTFGADITGFVYAFT